MWVCALMTQPTNIQTTCTSIPQSVCLSSCQSVSWPLSPSLTLFNSTRRHCGPRTENPNWALKVARRCVVDKHESIKPNEMFWPTTKATTIISNTHTQFSSTPTIVHTHTHTPSLQSYRTQSVWENLYNAWWKGYAKDALLILPLIREDWNTC